MKSKKLFVIYDKLGETFVSDIMMADSDVIMIRGFQTFLQKIEEDDTKKFQYSPGEFMVLRCLSSLDDKFNLIPDSGYDICNGKNFTEVMKSFIDKLED